MADIWPWIKFKAIPAFTALGLTRGTVTLEVKGRRTGKTIRLSVTRVRVAGTAYLVSLAGESQWVQNVRAAGGAATIISGRRTLVDLVEIPVDQRAPILQSARRFFGFQSPPTLADMARVCAQYPVFEIRLPEKSSSSG